MPTQHGLTSQPPLSQLVSQSVREIDYAMCIHTLRFSLHDFSVSAYCLLACFSSLAVCCEMLWFTIEIIFYFSLARYQITQVADFFFQSRKIIIFFLAGRPTLLTFASLLLLHSCLLCWWCLAAATGAHAARRRRQRRRSLNSRYSIYIRIDLIKIIKTIFIYF